MLYSYSRHYIIVICTLSTLRSITIVKTRIQEEKDDDDDNKVEIEMRTDDVRDLSIDFTSSSTMQHNSPPTTRAKTENFTLLAVSHLFNLSDHSMK